MTTGLPGALGLPSGFRAAGVHCGIRAAGTKDAGKNDLGLILAAEAWPAYALFTQSDLLGAHIPVCSRHLARSSGLVRAILVNAGNGNCATGEQGERDNERVCRELAMLLGCPAHQILFLSTGVIGERLAVDRIVGALPALHRAVREDGVTEFAEAILTTDTKPKVATGHVIATDGTTVQVCGIAKGSAMIHPDMATLLAFLITDGRSQADLRLGLRDIADRSFHRLTVDGDTSPNDTFLLWTTNEHWCRPVKDEHGMRDAFPLEDELTRVSRELARAVAADGEGATKLITLQLRGAMSEADAVDAGRFIATSAMVKTAVHGSEPDWGRILAATASTGMPIDLSRTAIAIGGHVLYADGEPHPENESAARNYMRANHEVVIAVDMGMGPFDAELWTCDLSEEYVRRNSDRRSP